MGRKKISIQRIEGERERQVTYGKRKMGMINKATELAVLTDAQVGLIAFGSNGKMTIYSSAPLEYIIARYRKHKDAPEVRLAARPHSAICTDCRETRIHPHTPSHLLGLSAPFPARAQVFTNEHYFREKRKKEGKEEEGDDESDEAEEGADDPRLHAPAHVQYAAQHQAPPPPQLMPYSPPPHLQPLPANIVHVQGPDGQPIPAHHIQPPPMGPPGYMPLQYAPPPHPSYAHHPHHPPPPQAHQIIHAAPHAAPPHGGYAMHPGPYPYYHPHQGPPPQEAPPVVPHQPFTSPPLIAQEIVNPPPNFLPAAVLPNHHPPVPEGANNPQANEHGRAATPPMINQDGPDSPPQPLPHNRAPRPAPSPPPMPLANDPKTLSIVVPERAEVEQQANAAVAAAQPLPQNGVSAVAHAAGQLAAQAAAAALPGLHGAPPQPYQPAHYPQYPQQLQQQQPQPGPPPQQPGYSQQYPLHYNVPPPPPHHAAYPHAPYHPGAYHQVMQPPMHFDPSAWSHPPGASEPMQ